MASCWASRRTPCGGCSRSTGRSSSRPGRSRSWPTGCAGRWSRWWCSRVALRRTPYLRAIVRDRRVVVLLVVASVVIGFNWGGFIYGVNSGRVVEVSLGYFINPLVTVLLGVLVLGERLRPLQWYAIGIAAVAVVILTVDYGHPPWIALLLAGSFGTYGLAKKKADVEAVESLTFETMLLAPLALAYILWLSATGDSNFGAHGAGHACCSTTTGLVTAVPLICFGAAAIRIPMTTLGLLQYLAPTHPVRARPGRLRRADDPGEVGRLRPGLARPGASSPSRRCATVADSSSWSPRPAPCELPVDDPRLGVGFDGEASPGPRCSRARSSSPAPRRQRTAGRARPASARRSQRGRGRDRRHGLRRAQPVRRAVPPADRRPARARRTALQPVPRHGPVLAHPPGADDRPQPPLGRAWASPPRWRPATPATPASGRPARRRSRRSCTATAGARPRSASGTRPRRSR